MDFKHKQLEQDLTALSRTFSELGARLAEVAKEVTAPGVIPSEKLLEQISVSRTSFEKARNSVYGHAGAMLVSPLPKLEDLMSIAAIDGLLKASAVAEETKFSVEGERERALAILGRVLSIFHREISDFKALQECHAKVGELRNGVANVVWPHRHPESDAIVSSKHPTTDLLHFVENLDKLDDDRWMTLETTITDNYGKPLFVAASRGKLAVRQEGRTEATKPSAAPPPAKAPASEPAKPAAAAEKPVEKKIVAEKAPEKPVAAPEAPVAPVAPSPKPVTTAAAPPPAPAVQQKPAPPAPVAPSIAPVAAVPAPTAPAAVAEKKPASQVVPAAPPVPVAATPVAPQAAAPVVAPSPAPVASVPPPAAPVAATQAAPPPRPPAPAPVAAPHAPAAVAHVIPTPAPVVAPPAPVAASNGAPPSGSPLTATMNSLSALATATEPAEKKPAAAPVDAADKQRKEPRLAAPQPQAVSKPDLKPQELPETAQQGIAADGSQRPQRWGFWRGNR